MTGDKYEFDVTVSTQDGFLVRHSGRRADKYPAICLGFMDMKETIAICSDCGLILTARDYRALIRNAEKKLSAELRRLNKKFTKKAGTPKVSA